MDNLHITAVTTKDGTIFLTFAAAGHARLVEQTVNQAAAEGQTAQYVGAGHLLPVRVALDATGGPLMKSMRRQLMEQLEAVLPHRKAYDALNVRLNGDQVTGDVLNGTRPLERAA